jgi:hypothetical protein
MNGDKRLTNVSAHPVYGDESCLWRARPDSRNMSGTSFQGKLFLDVPSVAFARRAQSR